MLKIGDTAPDFEAPLDDGSVFRLSEALAIGPLVLYFYPRDFTAGCTREAQDFRDVYPDIFELGAWVIGVSTDHADSHRRFREACRLPFPLATDTGGSIRDAYGVHRRFLGPGTMRVTFLIDREGVIRGVYDHELAIGRHVTDVLSGLRGLGES
jgi:peroxiredoxin Q/BCP